MWGSMDIITQFIIMVVFYAVVTVLVGVVSKDRRVDEVLVNNYIGWLVASSIFFIFTL
jgi:hypothetical protein